MPQKQKILTGIIIFIYCKTTDLANNCNITYRQAEGRGKVVDKLLMLLCQEIRGQILGDAQVTVKSAG